MKRPYTYNIWFLFEMTIHNNIFNYYLLIHGINILYMWFFRCSLVIKSLKLDAI